MSNLKLKSRRVSYETVQVTAEVDVCVSDVLSQIDNEQFLQEAEYRGLYLVSDFEERVYLDQLYQEITVHGYTENARKMLSDIFYVFLGRIY